jgi:hypothetical protein
MVVSFSKTLQLDEKLTGEEFNISSRLRRSNTPIYPIKDYNGEEITGTFYQSELQKIDINISIRLLECKISVDFSFYSFNHPFGDGCFHFMLSTD